MPAAGVGVNKLRALGRNFAIWLLLNCNTMRRLEEWRKCGSQQAIEIETENCNGQAAWIWYVWYGAGVTSDIFCRAAVG